MSRFLGITYESNEITALIHVKYMLVCNSCEIELATYMLACGIDVESESKLTMGPNEG